MIDEPVAQLEPLIPPADRPPTILVVDDDPSQVLTLQHRLEQQGYHVLAAFNAAQAREQAWSGQPDLVLLDLGLPDEDGLDLCAQLADHPLTCGVPLIVVTALDRPGIVRQARAAGGSYYVRKPYDPNVLLTLIEQSLRQAAEFDW